MRKPASPWLGLAAVLALSACAQPMSPAPAVVPASAPSGPAPVVGGAPMYPTRDIIDNAVNSADHTTLVAAVKAAGLVDTLKGPGPFTVFAPTNAAFNALPPGTVQTLLQPNNKAQLTNILTYHVIAQRLDSTSLGALIAQSGGRATVRSVAGAPLFFTRGPNGGIVVTDAAGRMAHVTIPDVYQSNGVIHVVDTVLLPNR